MSLYLCPSTEEGGDTLLYVRILLGRHWHDTFLCSRISHELVG